MRTMLLWAFALLGCGGDEPTFAEVGPIYEARCVSCHQEGGIGPFRLDNYEDAQKWAEASVMATAARSMPPFLVVGDGSCGDFTDSQWLSDEELGTIARWADAGAREGAGHSFALPDPPALTGTAIEVQTPEFVPEIVGGSTAEFDEYRCFAVDLPDDAPRFLTGYDVFPGNAAIVHHVIGMPVNYAAEGWNGRTNAEVIAELSDDGRDGWPCFEGAGDGVSNEGDVISWAPGQGAVEYPEGFGVRIGSNSKMVFQVHYNLVDPATRGQSDQTTVALRLEDQVDRQAYVILPDLFLSGDASVAAIPPGEPAASVVSELPVWWMVDFPVDFELVGVLPHMHERGRQMRVHFERGNGRETCVADVPNWDFNWQRIYFYETPIRFGADDTLVTECIYDTTGDTEPVLPGWGTNNEMCLPGLMVSPIL